MKEFKNDIIFGFLLFIAIMLTVLGFIADNDIVTMIAALLMAVCIIIAFARKGRRDYESDNKI